MNPTVCLTHLPPGQVALEESRLPDPPPLHLLVENRFSGVSPGTELRLLQGRERAQGPGGYVPGYQAVGRVIKTGGDTAVAEGDLVFVSNACPLFDSFWAQWGAHAKHVIVRADSVVSLGGAVMDDGGLVSFALGKLCAIAHNGLERACLHAADRVAVVGLGPLGQLSARLAARRGCSVVGFDRSLGRVEALQAAGVPAVVVAHDFQEALAGGDGLPKCFDVLIDTTGVPALFDSVIDLAREFLPWDAPEGRPIRYVVQGSCEGAYSFNYPKAFVREVQFLVPRDNRRSDLAQVMGLLTKGVLDLGDLYGAPVSPAEAPAIYHDLASASPRRMTAIFDWARV